MRWIEAKPEIEVVTSLQAKRIPRPVAILLANRGIDAGNVEAFRNPRMQLSTTVLK